MSCFVDRREVDSWYYGFAGGKLPKPVPAMLGLLEKQHPERVAQRIGMLGNYSVDVLTNASIEAIGRMLQYRSLRCINFFSGIRRS